MSKKLLFVVYVAFAITTLSAQDQVVYNGKVVDPEGNPVSGATVTMLSTGQTSITDALGSFSLVASSYGKEIVISSAEFAEQTIVVNSAEIVIVSLGKSSELLSDVVVTAYGIKRDKKSLGYAIQEVDGEAVEKSKRTNFIHSLTGKVAGVRINESNDFGGSAGVIIRGFTSVSGSSQPLYVIDGIPISNRVIIDGYDYGNAASDINPEDVESISVLKGPAASALYGSRAANGVILVTTKKGKTSATGGKTFSVNIKLGGTIGIVNKNTFAKYQKQYGSGYTPQYKSSDGYFSLEDVDGDGVDDEIVVSGENDASYGAKFDPSRQVVTYDYFVPESPFYQKKRPWVAGANDPSSFFENAVTTNLSAELLSGGPNASNRFSITRFTNDGIMPNSHLTKYTIDFSNTFKYSDKLSSEMNAKYIYQDVIGRNRIGYNNNLISNFRQWWTTNVDILEQKDLFDRTGKNYSWNVKQGESGFGFYWDNPYFVRHKNYQTDSRHRLFGYFSLNYQAMDWLKLTARVSIDTYNELLEERRSVGSKAEDFGLLGNPEFSGYYRMNNARTEMNYDFMANVSNFRFADKFSLSGLFGVNIRTENYDQVSASTAGGLVVSGLYAINNSAGNTPPTSEFLGRRQVNGFYANVSVGYEDFLYLELTDRFDISSTLPKGSNAYNYYSGSLSFIFSKFLSSVKQISFGKIRAGYSQVGSDAGMYQLENYLWRNPANFGSARRMGVFGTQATSNLKPEITTNLEFGLEMAFFNNRLRFDYTYYNNQTTNQLINIELSAYTGYFGRTVNAGRIDNSGHELTLTGTPYSANGLTWEIMVNWSKNISEVKELYTNPVTGEPLTNVVLSSPIGASFNARVGHPMGVIVGTDFEYDANGNKVVDANGYYKAKTNQIIGDPNPDWLGGITNTITYKGLSLSFLIDVRQGGDIFSQDLFYGMATGLYPETVGTNAKGNPVRDKVADGGGILLDGVKEDGRKNDIYARADYSSGVYSWGDDSRNPSKRHIYDGSYVKLKEVSLSYNLPSSIVSKSGFIRSLGVTLYATNLWIITKNIPYVDPEAGQRTSVSSQGYQVGVMPTTRNFGFNLNIGL